MSSVQGTTQLCKLIEKSIVYRVFLFSNPTDKLTMIPFLESMRERYGKFASTIVADSGYGSEENYHFMEEAGMDSYVKYNCFHRQQRSRYKVNPFHPEGMYYNEKEDYYVCRWVSIWNVSAPAVPGPTADM